MKQFDLLNEVAKEGRISSLTLSVYLVNEVDPRKFFREGVKVSSAVKIVQARALLGYHKSHGELITEGFLYVSVPKDQPLGKIVHLTGTLSPVTFEDYSPELSLLRFAKVDGRWVVRACMCKSYEESPYKEDLAVRTLKRWPEVPYALTSASGLVYPRTIGFDREVLYSVSDDLVGSELEHSKPQLGSTHLALTSTQKAVLEDMLTFPVLQLQVENEMILEPEVLGEWLKSQVKGRNLRVFDLRGRALPMSEVLKKLKGETGFTLETQFVLLVSQVTEGIPYVQIGMAR